MSRSIDPAPAGFYPDPEDPKLERWWDGTAWAAAPGVSQPARVPSYRDVAPPTPQTNQLALASLILSIAWIFFIGSILGVIFGHMAMEQIRESEGREVGRGNAMIGLIVGYTGIAVGLLALLILFG
ncbi:MAG: DUF4190 domain-containing protein [Acidimicrobiales bacterium]|nr:DUF4190 domain-containing protein [Acidimicrobiales bacterium]